MVPGHISIRQAEKSVQPLSKPPDPTLQSNLFIAKLVYLDLEFLFRVRNSSLLDPSPDNTGGSWISMAKSPFLPSAQLLHSLKAKLSIQRSVAF
jgi:hypothetical protein